MSRSDHTKNLLAESLKELMREKSIHLISVQDICKKCQMNRNSFYYHFLDKQDLVSWIYNKEILRPLSQLPLEKHWGDGTLLILKGLSENRSFYLKVLEMKGQNNFQESLFNETVKNFITIIDSTLNRKSIEEKSKSFIARFYAYSFTCMTIDWLKENTNESPEELMQRLVDVTDVGLSYAIKKAME